MATTPEQSNPRARLADVQADVARNRLLLEESRRKRIRLEAELRETEQTLERHRRRGGLFGWLRARY